LQSSHCSQRVHTLSSAAKQGGLRMNSKRRGCMDWSNTNHILQVLMVIGLVLIFLHGFNSGNKL
jgi:hypothetical protein